MFIFFLTYLLLYDAAVVAAFDTPSRLMLLFIITPHPLAYTQEYRRTPTPPTPKPVPLRLIRISLVFSLALRCRLNQ